MKNWARPTFSSALQRFDLLIHREILRLRANYQLSLDEFRGLYISDQQVDELIHQQSTNGQVDVEELTVSAEHLSPSAQEDLAGDERWHRLCQSYQLTDFEQDVLLMAFVPEIHGKYSVLFAYLNNDITRKYPTIELALNMFSSQVNDLDRQAFSSRSTLVNKGLILAVEQSASKYTLHSGFVISPTLREYLLGHTAIAPEVVEACSLLAVNYQTWQHQPFLAEIVDQFAAFSQILLRTDNRPYFVIESQAGSGASILAENSLFSAGLACCRIDLKRLLADREMVSNSTRSICQTALLEHAGLVIEGVCQVFETPQIDNGLMTLFFRELADAAIPTFLLVPPKSRWRELLAGYPYVLSSLGESGPLERQRFWQHHMNRCGVDAEQDDLAAVADFFQLSYEQVRAAASDLAFRHRLENSDQNAKIAKDGLFAAARQQSYGDMGELAAKTKNYYSLHDLVLPAVTLSRVQEFISAINSRRLVYEQWDFQRRLGGATGIVSLFTGASGTGKTMTASVIANEIGLDLYRIELSGIVSKYIGETEKNLDKIFKAAKQANCILFFDEADALFGKRSEVKDAHDRYANIEVAYLLQKIENHDGIVILTTNLAKSIDQAFTRRMQFIIEFPRPDVAHREELWRGMFGEAAPLADDVDFNFLARQLENTGGDIKNMALDAALMAASSERKVIDMALLVRAAARQMMKQGKVPSAIEFKHYFSLVGNNTD